MVRQTGTAGDFQFWAALSLLTLSSMHSSLLSLCWVSNQGLMDPIWWLFKAKGHCSAAVIAL